MHFALCAKGFDDAHTAQRFFELRHRFAPFDLRIHARLFEFTTDASHAPAHQGEHENGEKCEFPGNVEKTTEIDHKENRIFHQHLQTTHDRVFNFAHVTTHACDDVAFAFIAEEGEGKEGDFLINRGADVAHNARAHWHHRSHRSKVRSRFQTCGQHEK